MAHSFASTLDLPAVKVGQLVAWLTSHRLNGAEATTARVVKLTPTQIVVHTTKRKLEYRFRRDDGRMMGSNGWGVYLLNPSDDNVIEAVNRQALSRAIGEIREHLAQARCRTADEGLTVLTTAREMIDAVIEPTTA